MRKKKAPEAAPVQPEEVLLPTNREDLDAFVAKIVKKFKLPETDDTYESIATMIMHMPNTRAYAPLAYFGNGVLKAMANLAAYEKIQEFCKKRRDAALASAEAEKLASTPPQASPESVDGIPV